MTKTYLYIPDELDRQIVAIVRQDKISKAEVMRRALAKGLSAARQYGGAEVLLKIAELGKKYKVRGPKDGSTNLDKYLWGM